MSSDTKHNTLQASSVLNVKLKHNIKRVKVFSLLGIMYIYICTLQFGVAIEMENVQCVPIFI